MTLCYPAYYDRFACIADRCEDTCCAGWEIDIDDDSYEYYMSIEGEFGERLRQCIQEYQPEAEDLYEQHGFILRENKRCPFLDEKGLCDLYRELGESALCDVCTDTPRNFLEYGGMREISLSAACAEAGRLLYGTPDPIAFVERKIEEEFDWEEEPDEYQFACLIRMARDRGIEILQNRALPVEERIFLYLSYAEEVQQYLNVNNPEKIWDMEWQNYLSNPAKSDPEKGEELEDWQYKLFLRRMVSFSGLSSINEEWEEMLRLLHRCFIEREGGADIYREAVRSLNRELAKQKREYEYEHLIVYYVFLCQARCVDDYDFVGWAVLAVVSFLMIRDLDAVRLLVKKDYALADRVDIARIYAREVEHSEENLKYLADEFLFEKMYRPDTLRKAFLCS